MKSLYACVAALLITPRASAQMTLVAHYRLDNVFVADQTGNSTGAFIGGATVGQPGFCPGSDAVEFDGLSGIGLIPAHQQLSALRNDLTITAWINPSQQGPSRIFANESFATGGAGSWSFGLTPTGLRFTTIGIQDYDLGVVVAPGQWHHVAVVFDTSNDAQFYLNGAFLGSVAGVEPAGFPNNRWLIGAQIVFAATNNEFFDGLIDDVQVYSGSASAAEILSLFQSPCATIGSTGPLGVCNGDGGDQLGCTDCPCSNNAPVGTPGGCLNSSATAARLFQSGSNSVEAASLRFALGGAVPNSFAVLTSGDALAPQNMSNPCFGAESGVQSATLDGLRCAVQSVQRHGGRPVAGDGSAGMGLTPGWGSPNSPVIGVGGIPAQGGFVAGDTRYFQVFYRELPGVVCSTEQNTSQAIGVSFVP